MSEAKVPQRIEDLPMIPDIVKKRINDICAAVNTQSLIVMSMRRVDGRDAFVVCSITHHGESRGVFVVPLAEIPVNDDLRTLYMPPQEILSDNDVN